MRRDRGEREARYTDWVLKWTLSIIYHSFVSSYRNMEVLVGAGWGVVLSLIMFSVLVKDYYASFKLNRTSFRPPSISERMAVMCFTGDDIYFIFSLLQNYERFVIFFLLIL